jgi:hypothetical protein
MAAKLGLPALLGLAGRHRDLALALVFSRVVRPGSKQSTLAWWGETTWLAGRQDAIEAELARRHLAPAGMALFDLSSSWLEGSRCPLVGHGYSRGGRKGKLQIEYGLLTDPTGRPVAVRVLPGSTGDPAASQPSQT